MSSKAVPGTDKYLKVAQNALGGDKLTDRGGVQVEQVEPLVLDYVGRYSHSARTLMAGVL